VEDDAVARVAEERRPARLAGEDAALALLPRSRPEARATKRTSAAAGAVATTPAMWARKSASVRVGPHAGATICPVTTSRLTMKDRVPCRTYANSRRATLPGAGGSPGCLRSPRAASAGAAW